MKTTNYREVELNSILRVRLVCFHSGVGGGALLCVVVVLFAGSDVVGGACVGGGQGGFSDLILSMVEQDVGSVGHNLVLLGVGHLAVVKVIPLTVILVARVAGVMSVSESSVVI